MHKGYLSFRVSLFGFLFTIFAPRLRRLPDGNAGEAGTGGLQLGLQQAVDDLGDVFDAGDFAGELGDLDVEVLVVEAVDDGLGNDLFEGGDVDEQAAGARGADKS